MFAENCMKMKEIGLRGHISLLPLRGSASGLSGCILGVVAKENQGAEVNRRILTVSVIFIMCYNLIDVSAKGFGKFCLYTRSDR